MQRNLKNICGGDGRRKERNIPYRKTTLRLMQKNNRIAKYDGKELVHSSHMLRLISSRKTAFNTSVSGEELLAGYKP